MKSLFYGVVVLLFIVIADVQSIMFELQPSAKKCIKEEIHAQVLVTGEYQVSEAPGQRVDYVVSFILHFLIYFFFDYVNTIFKVNNWFTNLQYGSIICKNIKSNGYCCYF